ncbi:hypothetical protein THAOC_08514, partial [Thalassiosira oceanica]
STARRLRSTDVPPPSQKTRASDEIECEDTNAILKTCLSKITELQSTVAGLNSKVERLEGTVSELQERNTSLEERGAYLERVTSALVRLQDDFRFPDSEKFSGTNRQHFVNQMNTEAYDMCNRELKTDTRLGSADSDQILDDQELMPAWTRYADALRFSCLDVNAGIDFVASTAKRLKIFWWSDCSIPDPEAASKMCDALSSAHSVNFFDSCGESQIIGATILGSLINPQKESVKLSLTYNRMTGLDRRHATSLAANTRLEKLNLSDNHLNDEDAAVIAAGLRHNRKLKWLSIEDNSISDKGFASLCSAIYHQTCRNWWNAITAVKLNATVPVLTTLAILPQD